MPDQPPDASHDAPTGPASHGKTPKILLSIAFVTAALITAIFPAAFTFSGLWVLSTWLAPRVTQHRGRSGTLGAWLGFLLPALGPIIAWLIPRPRPSSDAA